MMSDPEKNNPKEEPGSLKEDSSFPDEEYLFSEEEPTMGSFDALQPQQSSEQAAASPSKKSLSFPDISKLFEKIKIKPIIDAVQQNFMLRIALIVILVLLITVLLYRCSANPLAEKTTEKIAAIPVQHTISKSQEVIVPSVPAVTLRSQSSYSGSGMTEDQFQRLEKVNSDLQSQVRDLSSQMSNLRSNADTTTASLKLVAEQLSQLVATIGNEAQKSAVLAEQIQQQQKNPFGATRMEAVVPQIQCALQAIIAGRAWLVCSNGETLTVRQGTQVYNYGEVRYIDAISGQVLTSSGQTITFSQEDS
ncbi:MAG: hypothetical protein NTZ86_05705 [Legionellales bacterium]|jgi:intracellular multiplication protein IcmG|nr:hypothetical protein [Legionellales bacterium]NDH67051.1 hypothetical protein [Gammaproteobacteria bacterium]